MDAKAVMGVVLLQVFLVTFSSIVAAQEEISFFSNNDCTGPGTIWVQGFHQKTCVFDALNRGSIMVNRANSCERTRVFNNRNCSGTYTADFNGSRCYPMNNINGRGNSAFWYRSCTPPREPEKHVCTSNASKTDGIVFTNHTMSGTWVLKCENASRLFSRFKLVSNTKKVEWLRSHSATFKPKDRSRP